MLGFLLRIIFVVFVVRILGSLARAVFGGPPRVDLPRSRAPEVIAPKPLVDRASAIDVPFTEERTEP